MFPNSPLTASIKPKGKKSAKSAAPDVYVPPNPSERMHDAANDARVGATRDWVEGRITTKQHAAVHARANKVLKSGGEPPTPKGWA